MKNSQDMKNVLLVFEGVMEGFFAKEAPSVLTCVSDAKNAFNDFKYAVKDFERKNVKGVEKGLH
jgi:hypothetical protein